MAQITAGVKVAWGTSTSATTKPTTWHHIKGITEIPEIGGAPETYETTSLDNLVFKTYEDGLKDTGGALGITANDTPEFRTEVKNMIAAQETSGNYMWLCIDIPKPISEHMVFKTKATPLGFGGASINGVLTSTLYVTPTSEPEWVTGNVTVTSESV